MSANAGPTKEGAAQLRRRAERYIQRAAARLGDAGVASQKGGTPVSANALPTRSTPCANDTGRLLGPAGASGAPGLSSIRCKNERR